MENYSFPELKIGNLSIPTPIIQGGMGVGVSLAGLASAVANEGGVGVIATPGIGMFEEDHRKNYKQANARALKKEILKAKSKTKGAIGVNIMIALTDHETLLEAALEAGADVIFMGAGLPLKIPQMITPERLQLESTRIVPIISSARAAQAICKSWAKFDCMPEAFVVEGPMAGGHLGFKKEQLDDPDFQLEKLVVDTIEALKPYEEQTGKKIPVIAAGGIYTGADIKKYLDMGAAGVQMATRFVATNECDVDPSFKDAYIHADKEDIMIIDSPVGLPGRAIRNKFLTRVEDGEHPSFKCPWKCLRTCDFRTAPYCIADALCNAKLGKINDGFAFAGANAWRVTEIVSVKELVQSLDDEYRAASGINKTVSDLKPISADAA